MKTPIVIIMVFSAISLIFFPGCQKKDNNSGGSGPATKTQFITQSSWKFSTATVGGTDASSLLQTCQKDNILTFISNGTGSVDEGATKCNSGDPQTNLFTWSLQSNETMLNTSTPLIPGGTGVFSIDALTGTTLTLSQQTNLVPSMGAVTIVVTFIH